MEAARKTGPNDQRSFYTRLKKIMSEKARDAALSLLAKRTSDGSVYPSEVARAIASTEDWREAMPEVHVAVDGLLAERMISLSWKDKPLPHRDGPYRIRAAAKDTSPT